MRISEIKTIDVINGEGLRVSVFVSGCTHYCKGCFNKKLWDFNNGDEFNKKHIDTVLNTLKNPDINYSGLSLLGGEPFENINAISLIELCKLVKTKVSNKSIWTWTGYTYEEIIKCNIKINLLKYIDVLVDGRFILSEKNLKLKYRGSNNQRLINVPKSLIENRIVLL